VLWANGWSPAATRLDRHRSGSRNRHSYAPILYTFLGRLKRRSRRTEAGVN
jgi:hypothetical protein